MYGIWIPTETADPADPVNGLKKVSFETPGDIFGKNTYTFIGACIERNIVFMGVTNQSMFCENNNIPTDLRSISVFDEPVVRGPVLAVLTDTLGNPVDISINDFC